MGREWWRQGRAGQGRAAKKKKTTCNKVVRCPKNWKDSPSRQLARKVSDPLLIVGNEVGGGGCWQQQGYRGVIWEILIGDRNGGPGQSFLLDGKFDDDVPGGQEVRRGGLVGLQMPGRLLSLRLQVKNDEVLWSRLEEIPDRYPDTVSDFTELCCPRLTVF